MCKKCPLHTQRAFRYCFPEVTEGDSIIRMGGGVEGPLQLVEPVGLLPVGQADDMDSAVLNAEGHGGVQGLAAKAWYDGYFSPRAQAERIAACLLS